MGEVQKRLDKEFDEYYDDYLPTKQFSRGKMPFNIVADVYVPLDRFIDHIFEKDIQARYGIGSFATAMKYLNGIENGSTTEKEYWKQLQQWSTDYPFKYDPEMDQFIDTRPEKIQKESKNMVIELVDTSEHVMLRDILHKKVRSYRNRL